MNEINEITAMKGLTPRIIATEHKNTMYNIPIYQRLFEWDSDKIEQLLDDLYFSYIKNPNEPYYVGMLTSTKNNNLVDGQQRFTVMTLLGIVMKEYYQCWNDFLTIQSNNSLKTRLSFSARPDDQDYLESLIINSNSNKKIIINNKMEKGQKCIQEWLIQKNKNHSLNLLDFCKYVFENLTFFISLLPYEEGRELNKYFEAMNSTGRNLESHEIQKIRCLKELKDENSLSKGNATKIWNIISQMDKPLIRRITEKKKTETDNELHSRYNLVLERLFNSKYDLEKDIFPLLNEYRKNEDNTNKENKEKSIKDIPAAISKDAKPDKHPRIGSYHGMLSFSEFLLQVLYIQLGYNSGESSDEISVNEFFDVQKLLKTFENKTKDWQLTDWEKYFENLLIYRLLFDYFVILIPNEEDEPFDLEFSDTTGDDSNDKKKLLQYQAMLYAGSSSKSFYLWLNPYLLKLFELYSNKITPNCKELLLFLKQKDNERYPKESLKLENLIYQNSPLYWFRRLDYYLWEKNLDIKDPVISNFRFRRGGRSIEHLYPQNESEQSIKWKDQKNVHRFGNLCLISSSFNSTQSNDSLTVKIARVEDQKASNKSLESIKLYEMYKEYINANKIWTEQLMLQHEQKMFAILEESYLLN